MRRSWPPDGSLRARSTDATNRQIGAKAADVKLGYFTMPVHPLGRSWHETLQEDREAIILADELGYHDAFVGEHLTDRCENITSSMMFQASLAPVTKRIKLASGTSNLSQSHPVLIAAQAAMLDNLTRGRFIFGISPGALACDAEVLGILDEDRNKIFAEAIDVILEIWRRDPPYDIDLPDNRFKVSTRQRSNLSVGIGYLSKPYQKPHPEIVGTVLAPYSKGVIAMGERDFHPLSGNFLLSKWLSSHWENYCLGKAKVGAVADIADWRIARAVFVADDDKTAERYARTCPKSPYAFYHRQFRVKLEGANRLNLFKEYEGQPDETLTLDYLMDRLVIYGSVDKVVDRILELREIAGPFGELVYAGMDWLDPQLAKRSMQLMAEEVIPRVNAAIGECEAA
jgi:alkanesulfonate monooxygenase SsuD/methylene tetrahydromethanopterin reductase-like flavin-dependent oxidoreductase (luciferase family)